MNPENFGVKKIEVRKAEFLSKLESVLEKCGLFVTNIDFDQCYDSTINKELVDIITRKCPNLQEIDVGFQNFEINNRIDVLMPIFDKLKRFDCAFDEYDKATNDKDLGNLLLLNEKLEFFSISSNNILNGNFLNAIRGESMKELIITFGRNIPFHTICRVSKFL